MDRTNLTAMLKPLQRRGLIATLLDGKDARIRRLALTDKGRALLDAALPIWRAEHDRLDAALLALDDATAPEELRLSLAGLAQV